MKVIADLQVHSKYARAVSPQMTLGNIAFWAEKKGIGLVGTGDFTHPLWFRELEANLEEAGAGVYRLRKSEARNSKSETYFLLTSEVSCIYSHKGKGRRVHIMVYLPTFSKVRKFNEELTRRGANLLSDGRPIIGLTLSQVAEIALNVEPKAIIIAAHVWTPWFGFYGHMSGFDSLEPAFGKLSANICAMETGLSSDPAMNWRIEELSNRNIVSFGDAHSLQKLGREATVFEVPKLSYENIYRAITLDNRKTQRSSSSDNQNVRISDLSDYPTIRLSESSEFSGSRILYTIEFYPEEGKYHYTGHRKCNVVYSPNEARKMGMICPVCGKSLTAGVMSRVETLASHDVETQSEFDKYGVRWIRAAGPEGLWPGGTKRPYVMLVPLIEIISEALGVGIGSQQLATVYDQLVNSFESEFKILLKTSNKDLKKVANPKVIEGIEKVRSGDIVIEPGYDGVFGKVKIWKEGESDKEKITADQ